MLLVVIPLLFVCEHSRPFSQVDYALIASQAGATLNNLLSHAQELVSKLRSLQLDQREFVCLKFLVLFSLGEYRERGGGVERSGYGLCVLSKSHLLAPKVEGLEINHKTAFTSPCAIRPSLLMSPSLLYRECQNSLVGQNCYSQKIVSSKISFTLRVFIQYVTKSICIIQKKIYE